MEKLISYWRLNRHDPIWWACVVLIVVGIWVMAAAPSMIMILFDFDQDCLPTREHGLLCRR